MIIDFMFRRLFAIALAAAMTGQASLACAQQTPSQTGQAFQLNHDLALVASPETLDAARLSTTLDRAGLAFKRFFGELPAGRGLIFDNTSDLSNPDPNDPEFVWSLRWSLESFRIGQQAPETNSVSEREKAMALLAAIDNPEALKKFLLSQAQAGMGEAFKNLSEEQRTALGETLLRSFSSQQAPIVARARALVEGSTDQDADGDTGPTKNAEKRHAIAAETLAHEVGHNLFGVVIWDEARLETASAYGSGAPDWLDEAAAILMEGDVLNAQRRRAFVKMIEDGIDFIPLDTFLIMHHPVLKRIEREHGTPEPNTPFNVSNSPEATPDASSNETLNFYTQTRGFIDYLLARTSNERVFLEIASHLKAGGTMASWLETGETALKSNLPTTIAALDVDFLAFSRAAANPAPN
ncbi:hypothetical protein JCM17846_28200 [Iodidimonas nitroreducens]|uniref:DUF1570 domain-containing protein n=1 Tax=Iodidimonas nitroreducens TaxID=1236968 RepID=A0A5A7NAK7_9PROT|nr:hypothetical protein [Iodidimonas nitroreducens]GAK34147.1 hypothetical protein AQ1_02043 [alpha proteobacterium Q-1]GER05138.1 hypothetical protein JCM17846_28200 [Iodidimonas nitroreducens]